MNKLARYKKMDNLIKRLSEEKDKLKDDIVKEVQALPGRNENKELVVENYSATVTYVKKVSWNDESILFFEKKDKECLTIKVDNKVVEMKEKKGILESKELDKLRTISYDSPRLFIKNKEEK